MVFEDFVDFFCVFLRILCFSFFFENCVGFVCWVCMNLASRPLVSELTLALAGALFL